MNKTQTPTMRWARTAKARYSAQTMPPTVGISQTTCTRGCWTQAGWACPLTSSWQWRTRTRSAGRPRPRWSRPRTACRRTWTLVRSRAMRSSWKTRGTRRNWKPPRARAQAKPRYCTTRQAWRQTHGICQLRWTMRSSGREIHLPAITRPST